MQDRSPFSWHWNSRREKGTDSCRFRLSADHVLKVLRTIRSQTAQVTLKSSLLHNTCAWFLQAQPEPCPGLSAALLSLERFHPKPVEHQPTLPHTKPSDLSPKEKDQPCNYLSDMKKKKKITL